MSEKYPNRFLTPAVENIMILVSRHQILEDIFRFEGAEIGWTNEKIAIFSSTIAQHGFEYFSGTSNTFLSIGFEGFLKI